MKKQVFIGVVAILVLVLPQLLQAQCSICTRTAQQMGEGPAKGLNGGILYLAGMPFLILGYIGYRWWKSNPEG